MTTALLIDMGNTAIKVCPATAHQLHMVYSLPSSRTETADSLGLWLEAICRRHGVSAVAEAVVCSVVPPLDPVVRGAVERFFGCPVRFVLHDITLPLENRYARPQEVGADRLLAAFAARSLFPEEALIIIDFGTATTFDCLLGNAYLGGLIAPGVLSSAAALGSQTAKLPHISLDLDGTELEIGTSTRQSMTHGILFGFAAMVEGLTQRLSTRLAADALRVVATGGLAATIGRITPAIGTLVPDLLVRGLQRIAFPTPTLEEET